MCVILIVGKPEGLFSHNNAHIINKSNYKKKNGFSRNGHDLSYLSQVVLPKIGHSKDAECRKLK